MSDLEVFVRAPLLTPVHGRRIRASSTLPGLPELPVAPDMSWFVVARAGQFGDAAWHEGEVLVCRGKARPGDTIVLVAKGHGRPRLGRLDGLRFFGDHGEPCHPGRWASAGPIVGAIRRRIEGWVMDLDLERRRPLRSRKRASSAQLALPFGAPPVASVRQPSQRRPI